MLPRYWVAWIAPTRLCLSTTAAQMTLAMMHELHTKDPHITVVDLSRNFGKEIALSAGLDHSRGEVVVILDADLQDPPELFPRC